MLLEEDSDFVAFVEDLAGVELFVVVLAGADDFVDVDALVLLTVPLLFAGAGLVAALSELSVLCLREVPAF